MRAKPLDTKALHLLRDLAPQVLGVVARRYGDFAAAEDAVQEALIAASVQWPSVGIPTNPRGWLYHVAMRRLVDHSRSDAARRRREESVASLNRPDLSNEAIRLSRNVLQLLPNDGEVAGLLALMLLTDARRRARTGEFGELIPLDEQNRGLWDRELISEGIALVSAALLKTAVGPYQIQAAIAAVHDEAVSTADTDWPQIIMLYGLLEKMLDNPIVTLNKAIAVAMVSGPSAGLQVIASLETDPRISGHYRVDAVRGHLFELAGDVDKAVHHYRAAASRTLSIPERNYLTAKAARYASNWLIATPAATGTAFTAERTEVAEKR